MVRIRTRTRIFRIHALLSSIVALVLVFAPAALAETTPPTNPTLTPQNHTVSTWSNINVIDIDLADAFDAESGVRGFKWIWNTAPTTNPAHSLPVTGDETTMTVTSATLPDGSAHYLHLTTVDYDNNWQPTPVHVGPFFIDTTAPVLPDNVADGATGVDSSATSSTTTLSLHWDAATDATSGVDHYETCVSEDANGSDCATTATATWQNNGAPIKDTRTGLTLAEGSTYYGCVAAFDEAGNASPASCSNGQIVDTEVSPPTECRASSLSRGSVSEIKLVWAAAADTTGLNGYRVRSRRAPSGSWVTLPVNASLTQTIKQLDAGATYDWEVRSVEQSGLASSPCSGSTAITRFTRITGTAGRDTLVGFVGRDIIRGLAGNDMLFGNQGADRIFGGSGDDLLQGASGADLLDGGAGGDNIQGGLGSDAIMGGGGDDSIYGGAGHDSIRSGPGNDRVNVRDGKPGDRVRCGTGDDLVFADASDRLAADCEHRSA